MSGPGLAYFTSVDRYLRYDLDPAVDRVADGYPKKIAEGWGGIVDAGFTSGLDAGLDLGAGKLYLFRGDQYVRTTIAAGANVVDPDYPKPIGENWPGLADHGFGINRSGPYSDNRRISGRSGAKTG